MKRYMVFYGDEYYPSGGVEDLIGFSDTIECSREIAQIKKEKEWPHCDKDDWHYAWFQIYDSIENKILFDKYGVYVPRQPEDE